MNLCSHSCLPEVKLLLSKSLAIERPGLPTQAADRSAGMGSVPIDLIDDANTRKDHGV